MIYLLLTLNFAISWWNCYAVGGMWAESKALGGFPRLLAWSGLIQAAVGFSMVFGIAIGAVVHAAGYLPPRAAEAAMSLWYLAVIVPVIGSGIVITVHSWIVAYRERSIANMGIAAWNTFAQAYNTYTAIDGVGEAFAKVVDFFTSDDNEDGSLLAGVVVAVALSALASGVVLAWVLVCKYAGRLPAHPAEARA